MTDFRYIKSRHHFLRNLARPEAASSLGIKIKQFFTKKRCVPSKSSTFAHYLKNIGMRSMQELFFGLGGLRWDNLRI